ncbi:aminoacyl-histidine dipeptidase [Cellulosilyticum sp. I15G10I2]|uniref:aminoacyl-histidine dipeptidase n=1 Tax=Cellulosilyticum sp. I15G10I2 TaxID=1892843 RepID=UPI00085C31BB|nr:aminoacyl-histidine dipeptidase [Cellulosilyticum sp. I15G10I2]
MTKILKDLRPANVFKYFEEISSIPRGSGNEKAVSDHIVEFAKDLGLWVMQDEVFNVYIRKPATAGYENAPTVILQGHLDMVCEKTKTSDHDFENKGLELCIEDDYIRAADTTLGADNGVAIAYQMAVLADMTLKHPELEILMTTDEERGMTGASHIHTEYLKGKVLINLDTDVEGEFLVSCAGGTKATINLKLDYELNASPKTTYRIMVSGLLGGHSGADIHLERGNAHIIMGRVLSDIRKEVHFNLCEFSGGTKDNVITRECECLIAVDQEQASLLEKLVRGTEKVFKAEYSRQDSNISITANKEQAAGREFSSQLTQDIIDLLLLIPNGIISYDQAMQGLVETSLNLGIVGVQNDVFRFGSAIRSAVPSKKQALVDKMNVLSKKFNGEFKIAGDYPAWQYCEESKIRDLSILTYKQMYGKNPEIKSIHAGLECGFIAEKIEGLDMIAFGPNVKDIHSPQERVSISSMARVYEYLIKLLENIVTY